MSRRSLRCYSHARKRLEWMVMYLSQRARRVSARRTALHRVLSRFSRCPWCVRNQRELQEAFILIHAALFMHGWRQIAWTYSSYTLLSVYVSLSEKACCVPGQRGCVIKNAIRPLQNKYACEALGKSHLLNWSHLHVTVWAAGQQSGSRRSLAWNRSEC